MCAFFVCGICDFSVSTSTSHSTYALDVMFQFCFVFATHALLFNSLNGSEMLVLTGISGNIVRDYLGGRAFHRIQCNCNY